MRQRVEVALRKSANWRQLGKFCIVGISGYAVNLAVYAGALAAGRHYASAAVLSFLVAASNNYVWNRAWTFKAQRGHVVLQGLRFLTVSLGALAANVLILHMLVTAGVGELTGQAIAIVCVTPVNFIGNRLWSFSHRETASLPAGAGSLVQIAADYERDE